MSGNYYLDETGAAAEYARRVAKWRERDAALIRKHSSLSGQLVLIAEANEDVDPLLATLEPRYPLFKRNLLIGATQRELVVVEIPHALPDWMMRARKVITGAITSARVVGHRQQLGWTLLDIVLGNRMIHLSFEPSWHSEAKELVRLLSAKSI